MSIPPIPSNHRNDGTEVLRVISDYAPVGIMIFNGHKILYTNERLAQMTGYSAKEILNFPAESHLQFIHPDSMDFLKTKFVELQAAKEGTSIHFVAKGLRKNGDIFWMDLHSSAITYEGQRAIIANGLDLTAQKQAADTSQERTNRLAYIFQNAVDIVVFLDPKGTILEISPPVAEITGYLPEELVGKKLHTFPDLPLLTKALLKTYLSEIVKGKKSVRFEFDILAKNGVKKTIETVAGPVLHEGKVDSFYAIGRDVTIKKVTLENLRLTNQFLDLIIDNIPSIVSVKDASTLTFLRVNKEMETLLGLPRTQILGKTANDLFSLKFARQSTDADQRVLESKTPVELLENSTSTQKIYRTRKIPILDANSQVQFILSISEDVTSQRLTEQERQILLEKAIQLSDLKTNLLATASHELKTPLTPIYGWAQLLSSAKKEGKDLNFLFDLEAFESMERNSEKLLNLINELLDVGRIEGGKLSLQRIDTDFREVLEIALQEIDYFANQKRIRVICEGESQMLSIDQQRMEQVLVNILLNAIKYSPPDTTVSVKMDRVHKGERDQFRVRIIDTGFGFTSKELTGAFQPFAKVYTEQSQKKDIPGTGLGLFITRSIVEQHSGTLRLRSKGVNQGTTVEIRLPLESTLPKKPHA